MQTEPSSPSPADEEAAVAAFLSDPVTYPHHPSVVVVIDTHMSRVFLAGEWAYKAKKRLRFEFVDFTSLESRRLNSEREIAINQRLAPGIYDRVLPVTRESNGVLALDGTGDVIEWLVLMRRFERKQQLDQAIARGECRVQQIDEICELLARFYASTPRIEVSPQEWLAWWNEAIDRIETSLLDPIFPLSAQKTQSAVRELRLFLDQEGALLADRAGRGRIVDGHGDLRPEHVNLGPPLRLVDRLEFNERLRWIDPFDEAIFLGMECERLGADWIGNRLVECLGARLGESVPRPLLDFYRRYRACLRASLSIEHLRDPAPRTPERWPRQANEYLELAGAQKAVQS